MTAEGWLIVAIGCLLAAAYPLAAWWRARHRPHDGERGGPT